MVVKVMLVFDDSDAVNGGSGDEEDDDNGEDGDGDDGHGGESDAAG